MGLPDDNLVRVKNGAGTVIRNVEDLKFMENQELFAPGWPGSLARWTSSAKSGVGTALSADSRVWFTLSHGIINEIYYPQVDQACTRDVGLIVTDGSEFFSEEKRHTHHQVEYLADGVPAFQLMTISVTPCST